MTRHAIAWTHDGRESAWLEAPSQRAWWGGRHAPVALGTLIAVDARDEDGEISGLWTHFPRRGFADAGCGWVGAFRTVPNTSNLFGVHCSQRAVTADIREVTIAWTNAVTDTKTHGGAVYFRDLRFEFEAGWTALQLSRPAVDANETQYFPALAQLTRRFVLYRGNNRERAFAHLKSPPNPPIRAFGPSRTPIPPGVSIAEENRLLEILASGAPSIPYAGASELGFYHARMGVWMPYGDPKAYAHGGEDIYPVPRLGSPVWHQIRSDATAERQRAIALRADGRPIEAHEWPSNFEYRCDAGPHPIMRLPPFRIAQGEQWVEKKWNTGTCAYEPDFATRQNERGYSRYDPHHGCRAILDALAHYYKTGCPLNRLRVQLAAQDYMTSYRLTRVGNEDPAQGWVMHSLHALQTGADRAPGSGGRIQREMAWIAWTVAHAIAITPPSDPMRSRMQEWVRAHLRYLTTVRLKNGAYYCGWPTWSDDNIPWTREALASNGWPDRALTPSEGEAPTFQFGLLAAGLDEACAAVGASSAEFIAPYTRWLYGKPDRWVRDQYNASGRGPAWYARVFANGAVDREYTFGVGYAHTVHSRDTLARCYRATGDATFLELARRVGVEIPLAPGETAKQALARTHAYATDPWSVTMRAVATKESV